MEHWIGWFHERTEGDEVRVVAETAEALGFTGVALADHIALPKEQEARHPVTGAPFDPLVPNLDPFTVAAAMGAATTRLRFMSYALVAGMRDPFTIARQSASVAGLTGGRFSLGITPGWLTDEIRLLGHDPRTRGRRFDEALQVIQGLWTNDLFSFSGDHYAFEDVAVCPRPAVPPRLMIGGDSRHSFERARRYDGWIGMTMSVDEVAEIARTVRADDDAKAIYMIASEPMSSDYIERLEAAGVDGLVSMVWLPGDPGAASVEAKTERLSAFAEAWIR